MLKLSCHCGAIRVEIARLPTSITECNCSICRRYGARWAYYSRRSTRLTVTKGALERYARGTDLHFGHCGTCGCVVLWEPIVSSGDKDRIGLNMRLIEDPESLAGIRINRFDGAKTWRIAKRTNLTDPRW